MNRTGISFTIFVTLFVSLTPISIAGTLSDDDLASQVTIRRDTFGVPHILAETEVAAAFGYGYAAAEDHVLPIARLYLKARSEEAQYFGPEHVESDLLTK